MSNLPNPQPDVPAPTPTPAPAAGGVARNVLPEGLKIDNRHSADGFFEAHKAANVPEGAPASPPLAPAAANPPTPATPAGTPAVPAKGSLAEKLVAKGRPAPAPPPPPAPAPAPAGKNPEDDIVLAPGYSAPAHESFAKIKNITVGLRDQLNAAREEAKKFKAELETARAGSPPPDTAELERMRADHKSMSDRLMLVDLREHPAFHNEFVAPQNAALAAAAELLSVGGVTGVDVQSLLGKTRAEFGKAVSAAAQQLSDFDRTEFAENMRRAWAINEGAKAALGKSKETYTALRTQTETSQRQAFERTWGRSAGQLAEHIVELEAPENATPEMRAAVEDYNASYKGLRTIAEQRAFGPATSEAVSENAIKSAAYDFHIQKAMPKLMGEFQALLNLNRHLTEQLQAIRRRNPNFQISGAPAGGSGGGGGDNADGTLSEAQLSKMTHAEAAAALAPRHR